MDVPLVDCDDTRSGVNPVPKRSRATGSTKTATAPIRAATPWHRTTRRARAARAATTRTFPSRSAELDAPASEDKGGCSTAGQRSTPLVWVIGVLGLLAFVVANIDAATQRRDPVSRRCVGGQCAGLLLPVGHFVDLGVGVHHEQPLMTGHGLRHRAHGESTEPMVPVTMALSRTAAVAPERGPPGAAPQRRQPLNQ